MKIPPPMQWPESNNLPKMENPIPPPPQRDYNRPESIIDAANYQYLKLVDRDDQQNITNTAEVLADSSHLRYVQKLPWALKYDKYLMILCEGYQFGKKAYELEKRNKLYLFVLSGILIIGVVCILFSLSQIN
jgi:hypothetical protein